MRSVIKWLVLWFRPDRRSLSELAEFLRKRKKAASRWDHSHLTRRLATRADANEYRELSADKRHVLLQAARFSVRYYSVSTLPVLALFMALFVPVILKQADVSGILVDVQVLLVVFLSSILVLVGINDLYGASKMAAHAQTWVSMFEDVEKELTSAQSRTKWWKSKTVKSKPSAEK